jgi:peroxiredoxin Q/BCP
LPLGVTRNKGADVTELEAGKPAPGFDLPSDGGGSVRLSDFRGRKVVVYFYPQDDTKSCTVEAIDFSTLLDEFEKAGVMVIGISPDSAARHGKFRKKHGLTVILASDEDHRAIDAYGVWAEKTLYGRKYMGVVRSTFLIQADGTIARIWENVRVRDHARQVLEAAKAL